MTKLLLVLLLALTSCTTHAHDTAAQLSHMVRSRIETHTRERLNFKSSREHKEANVGSKSTSRQLQAPVIGRTLLIHAEYQLQQLDPGTASYVQSIVGAAIQNVQSYLSLNTTSPPSPLLVTPVTYSQNACINANLETYLTGKNCSSPGYSPDFNASLPVADVRSPYCGPAKLNQSHILSESCLTGKGCQISDAGGPGLVTDYYLYVTSDVSGSCSANLGSGSATAAFGIPCFFDNYVGRPILGAFNICPIAFQVYTTSARLINVITHEMLHALGFNNALFPWFSSATDGTSDQIMQSIPASSTLKAAGMRNDYLVMISPTVKREARAQFNCPSLAGAALEDQGGSGSVGESISPFHSLISPLSLFYLYLAHHMHHIIQP